ncbi:hypothetical protein [Zavarzinia sp.]|jgi:hypothetical protein|uniref:hypothetical protein n=1 Tax=Zavarzinia sp. TaxID=2027920 RepID=UPI00356B2DEA
MGEALDKALEYAGAMAAIAKAAGVPELIEILDLELDLRDALIATHAAASEAAIARAVAMASGAESGQAIAEAVGPIYTRIMLAGSKAAIPAAVDPIYRAAKEMAWRRARGKSAPLDPVDRPEIPNVAKAAKGSKVVSVRPAFDVVDDDAIEAVSRLQLHWVGDYWDDTLQARVAQVAQTTIESGQSGSDLAGELATVLRRELDLDADKPFRPNVYEVPAGWQGSSTVYWEGLASNAMTTARVAGSVTAMRQIRVTRFEVREVGDERTCTRCSLLDGKIFTVQQAGKQLDDLLAADSKDAVKAVAPWLSAKELGELTAGPGHVSDADSAALAAAGVCLPPYHYLCRGTIDVSEDAELEGGEEEA